LQYGQRQLRVSFCFGEFVLLEVGAAEVAAYGEGGDGGGGGGAFVQEG